MKTLRRLRKKWRTVTLGKSYALSELDWKLRRYINFRNGFYVEAGANDGIRQSNTLHFEKYLGWHGLLIEPIPELARQCQVNRPNSLVESCALVPSDHVGETVEMQYCNLMSLVKGAMKDRAAEQAHLARGQAIQKVDTYNVRVPARTLTEVLDAHEIKHVDLLSLDVEGYELQVLQGIDFKRHTPDYLLVEARRRDEIESFLAPWYRPPVELSFHAAYSDVLFVSRKRKA